MDFTEIGKQVDKWIAEARANIILDIHNIEKLRSFVFNYNVLGIIIIEGKEFPKRENFKLTYGGRNKKYHENNL